MVSSVDGHPASALRMDSAPSPGAARPGPPLPSPRAHRPRVCRRAGRHLARATGPVGPLAPLSPRLPRWSQPGVLARVCGPRHCEPSVRLRREALSRDRPPRPGLSRREGGAKKPVPLPRGPEAVGPPRGLRVPRLRARPSPSCALPGPPPPPRRVARGGLALGPPPASPALLRDRADEGAKPRPLAGTLGSEPVGLPRRSRVGPWASARELGKRRTAIKRVLRRLQGFRRLCSQCEQRDVLCLGCIVFALIIDACGVTVKLRMESRLGEVALTPPSPETPALQGNGAVAAIERDDRSAIFERVPRCRPSNKSNRTRRGVQTAGSSLHTWRIEAGGVTSAARASPHMFRGAGGRHAHVTAAQVCSTKAGLLRVIACFARYGKRRRGRRTRYRGGRRAGVVRQCGRGHRQRGRSHRGRNEWPGGMREWCGRTRGRSERGATVTHGARLRRLRRFIPSPGRSAAEDPQGWQREHAWHNGTSQRGAAYTKKGKNMK